MAIWIDMTNSLRTWKGAIVGVVRAELEIAQHYKKQFPDLRISVCENNSFVEIPEHDLNWLWESENAGDSYVKAMGRSEKAKEENFGVDKELHALQQEGMEVSHSRVIRLKVAAKVFIATLPAILRPFAWFFWWLFYFPIKIASAIRTKILWSKPQNPTILQPQSTFSHPYSAEDIILTAGWIESDKESAFSQIKNLCDRISLVYIIYDLLLIQEGTTHLYADSLTRRFREYFEWVSLNCDYILYGGSVAQADGIAYQNKFDLPIVKSDYIKFGANLLQASDNITMEDVRRKYKIDNDYILAVGSIDPRKNYDTIYKSYNIMMDEHGETAVPQLIIIGKNYFGADGNELLDTILRDPRTKQKIIVITPTDEELDLIYKNCQFVILPSIYEGWSLTLPEALNYKKFCLVSNARPIQEVGKDFVAYIDPIDLQNPRAWADGIWQYFSQPDARKPYESKVLAEWKSLTWEDCANQVREHIESFQKSRNLLSFNYYFDLSLAWHSAMAGNKITGILRAELMLLRYISRYIPNMRYYAYNFLHGYQPINKYTLRYLLGSMPIDEAFEISRVGVGTIVNKNESIFKLHDKAYAYKLFCAALPYKLQKSAFLFGKKHKKQSQEIVSTEKSEVTRSFKDIPANENLGKVLPFKKNDVIFSPGTGSGEISYATLYSEKMKRGFQYTQILYDFTPTLMPQVHQKETVREYTTFIEYASEMSDLIFYGGRTAMGDGIAYQKKMGYPTPEGYPIKFGSDILGAESKEKLTEKDEKNALKALGVKGDFIIVVGTIEIRKNHDTLYKAYLRLLEEGHENLPQLLFIGRIGWKANDSMNILRRDERVKDKILLLTPDDWHLDILYRYCSFTILASLYEGWSLTLPESLSYGKFCLTADTEPLKETGRDLVEYVTPFDVAQWANRILYYSRHPEEVKKWEKKIAEEWHTITWEDCAKSVADKLLTLGTVKVDSPQ